MNKKYWSRIKLYSIFVGVVCLWSSQTDKLIMLTASFPAVTDSAKAIYYSCLFVGFLITLICDIRGNRSQHSDQTLRRKTASISEMNSRRPSLKASDLGIPVRLSVCLSVDRVDWQNERTLPTLRSHTTWKIVHPSFLTRRMVGGGRPLLPEILGPPDAVPSVSLVAPWP